MRAEPHPGTQAQPQPEMVTLEEAGTFGARVLDVGCGTGALSLYLASRGHHVVGVDGAAAAVEAARSRAAERGFDVEFVEGDVLATVPELPVRFDSIVDVGFFHALTDEQRVGFAQIVSAALNRGGVYAMLCFSERVPGDFGPRRVSEAEIRATFTGPEFSIREVRAAQLHTAVPSRPTIDANLALVERA